MDVTELPLRDDLPEAMRPTEIRAEGDGRVFVRFPNGREDVIPDWQYREWFVAKS